MANAVARADLKARVLSAAPSAAAGPVPIDWPNEAFDAPDPPAPWIRVDLSGGTDKPIELGGATWEDRGQAWIHVFVPRGTGTVDADALVDQVKDLFRAPPPQAGVVIYTAVHTDPGDDDGPWWRVSVAADWKLWTIQPRT